MAPRMVSTLLLRLAGLLTIIFALTSTARNFVPLLLEASPRERPVASLLIAGAVALVLPLVLGALLACYPKSVAERILRIPEWETTVEQAHALQQVAFSATGLWLATYAIVDAAYFYGKLRLFYSLVTDMPNWMPAPPISPDDFGGFVSCAVQFVIGILLLLGARGLSNLVIRLRG